MFENCNSLLELNQARVKAVKDNPELLESINREYQAKRTELVQLGPKFKQLKAHRPVVEDKQLIMAIPYLGPCDKELTIKYTKKGFLC